MQPMPLTFAVSMLVLVELMVFGAFVGWARVKFGVTAPATTGNEVFERYFRVHYNTIENAVVALPAGFAFAQLMSDLWAAALLAVFVVARAIYFVTYVRDPKTRGAGAMPSFLVNVGLILGALFGAVRALL